MEQVEKFLQEIMEKTMLQHFLSRRNGCKTTKLKGKHHLKLIKIEDLVQRVSFNFQYHINLLSQVTVM